MKNVSKNTQVTHRLSFGRRLTAAFMAGFLLLQICLPGVAAAAILLTNDQITSEVMSDYQYQPSTSSDYLFEQAAYFNQVDAIQNQTILGFHKKLVAAKIGLPAPTYIPIAGDITVFIPHYPVGKLLGDAYVQNRYIRSQINDLLGRHLIDTALYSTELIQINKLYTNAETFARNNGKGYVYGSNLSATEVISSDMIWPELRVINGQKVMVPIVYLTANTLQTRGVKDHTIEFAGTSAEFDNIILDKVTLLTRRNAFISTVGNIVNNGGTISADGELTLAVAGTLQNISGNITAEKNLTIIAGQINNKTLVHPYTDKNGSGTRLGQIASINSTTGSLTLQSYGDIIFEGATASSNGGITFQADGNIILKSVFTETYTSYRRKDWKYSSSSIDVAAQSKLTANERIQLIAGGAIQVSGAELISTRGGIELLASQGIYVLDELNQIQIQGVDRKGKTTGQSSEFRTEAVRAVLNAGKGVLLDTEFGDVTLKAAKITSVEGTNVTARNGKVNLLMTKELEEFHRQTVSKGTWTIKVKSVDLVHETNTPNAIVGGFAVHALNGVEIEYTGKPKLGYEEVTLAEQIEEYRKMPGMEWMAEIYDQSWVDKSGNPNAENISGSTINWAAVEEVHKEIRKSKTSLSPAAMAIIAIAVCVAMGPGGAGLIGSGGTGAIGTLAGNATLGAALNAGAVTLATQAAQSLAAGNNLRETLNAMDSDDSLKSLAVSMATAGAMQHTNVPMFEVAENAKMTAVTLAQQAAQAVVNSAVTAGISVSINGGNSDDYLNAFKASLKTSAINTIGDKFASKITNAETLDVAAKYITHAALGCMTASLTNQLQDSEVESENSCASGAGGAVISQYMADKVYDEIVKFTKDGANSSNITLNEINTIMTNFKSYGADINKLVAGLTAFALGGDVNAAADSADRVARSNILRIADLAHINNAINGRVEHVVGATYQERVKAVLEDDVRLGLEKEGFDPATINSVLLKSNQAGVFDKMANFQVARTRGGQTLEMAATQRAHGVVLNEPIMDVVLVDEREYFSMTNEVYVDGVPYSELVKNTRDVLGATNELVNTMTPDEREAVGFIFNAATGGVLKTSIAKVVEIGVVKLMPPELMDAVAQINTSMATAGVAFINNRSYQGTVQDVSDSAAIANEELPGYGTDEVVDGLAWLLENITGFKPVGKNTYESRVAPPTSNINSPNTHSPNMKEIHPNFVSLDDFYKEAQKGPIKRKATGKYSHDYGAKYNDGKIGEAATVDVLEASTGKKFVAIQNGSGHGPDGVYIDYDTSPATIYIAEAKSSINGVDAARAPVGSPEARLDKWIIDFDGGRYDNVDAATKAKIKELKDVYVGAEVKGLWVQVGVPPVNISYTVDLDVTINAW